MLNSLRIAIRALLKTPGFTIISLLTLALAIGVNTSMFTLVNTLLYRSAPFPHADRLVRIWDTSQQNPTGNFSIPELEELRAHASLFDSVTTFAFWVNSLAEPGQPAQQLTSLNASPEFFTTFGAKPILGRPFTAEEEVAGRNNVAILSYELWQKRFGGRRDIVGQDIRLSTEPVTVIGVMPASFQYPLLWGQVDLWRPIALPRHLVDTRDNRMYGAIGLLKPGITIEQAEAQLAPLAERFAKDYPARSKGHGFRVQRLHESLVDSTSRGFSWMLYGLSGFVLLIACANLANLQLARATANAREFAIRSALGASRSRLVVHQLTECMMLSFVGGGLGLLVALWINAILEQRILIGNQPSLTLPIDGPVLLAALIVSLASGIVFGLVPALLASRTDVNTALKQQTRGSTSGRAHHRIRHALIVGEIALALVLLAGASVMVRGFNRFLNLDHGWDTKSILTATLHPPEETRYSTPEKRRELHEKLERRLAEIPGVEAAALTTNLPIGFYSSIRPFEVVGQTSTLASEQPIAAYSMVTKDYFKAVKISLIEGNLFSPDVRGDGPSVVLVNQSLARKYWPNESAVGKYLNKKDVIVGVVSDIDFAGNPSRPLTKFQVYRPLIQEPWGYVEVVLRSSSPESLKRELARAITDVDADVAVDRVYTVPEYVDQIQHNFYLIRQTLEAFALLGLALASIGLYGVISNVVVQRTAEFGIRLALGALPKDVLNLVLTRGLQLAVIGVALGLLGAYGITRMLLALMPRLSGIDPVGMVLVAVVLFCVALISSWIPARRATQVDPLIALRADS